jgi:hypothetical protein
MAEPSDDGLPLHYPVYTSPLGDKGQRGWRMVELKVYLSEVLNERFRRIAMGIYGYGRGSLSKAAEEAFTEWCTKHDAQPTKESPNTAAETAKKPIKQNGSRIDPDERQIINSEQKEIEDIPSQQLGSSH